jgi:hypothetical protein
MLVTQPLIGWLCVVALAALAARSLTRLAADFASSRRALSDHSAPSCGRTSRVGEALHAAMALGMAAMVAAPVTAGSTYTFEAYFGLGAAAEGGVWAARAVRRRAARLRGGVAPCRPAHALEPHHAVVGLVMVLMAARMSGAGPGGGAMLSMSAPMASMPGMTAGSGGVGAALATLALLYVWLAVVVLGGGLGKSALAQPASPQSSSGLPAGLALLGAPVTVYACELTMTVVMGLMLLG